ncbi:MAG: hypothetical protein K8R88_10765 [Armatimonadetes bacterium]|nr:hypothetical protein [Armatimonadota bacterium]
MIAIYGLGLGGRIRKLGGPQVSLRREFLGMVVRSLSGWGSTTPAMGVASQNPRLGLFDPGRDQGVPVLQWALLVGSLENEHPCDRLYLGRELDLRPWCK